jgi:hypothetical protein
VSSSNPWEVCRNRIWLHICCRGLPIEIKYGQKVAGRELRGIRDFIKENKCPYGIVINNDECVRLYDENLLGIPFACCLDGKTGGESSEVCINQKP